MMSFSTLTYSKKVGVPCDTWKLFDTALVVTETADLIWHVNRSDTARRIDVATLDYVSTLCFNWSYIGFRDLLLFLGMWFARRQGLSLPFAQLYLYTYTHISRHCLTHYVPLNEKLQNFRSRPTPVVEAVLPYKLI